MYARPKRDAFTLVELMLAIAIILVLGVIALPLAFQARKDGPVKGATFLQGTLAQTKSTAQRDRLSTGIRFIPAPNRPLAPDGLPQYYDQIELIQELPPFTDGSVSAMAPTSELTLAGATFFIRPQGSPPMPMVTAGDTIELYGGGQVYQIVKRDPNDPNDVGPYVDNSANPPVERLPLSRQLTSDVAPTLNGLANYRIFRQPRPIPGEKVMKLPDNTAIDLFPYRIGQTNSGSHGVDRANPIILFGPSGRIVGPGASEDMIVLWVQDLDDVENATLLVIYTKTGGVASYPVHTAGGDKYRNARNGHAAGSF